MAKDTSLPLRQAIVTILRADAALTALVPAGQNCGMRPPTNPAFPYTRYGAPDSLPLRAQCLDGATVGVTVHSFSDADYEDECANINAALAAALDGKTVELDTDFPAKAHIVWVGSQIMADAADASLWHGVNRFEASVAS